MFELLVVAIGCAILFWNRKLSRRLKQVEAEVKLLQHGLSGMHLSAAQTAISATPIKSLDGQSSQVGDDRFSVAMAEVPASLADKARAAAEISAEVLAKAPADSAAQSTADAGGLANSTSEAMAMQVGQQAPDQSASIVFTSQMGERLKEFLRDNWVYVISAVSLALAGVFLVQYGIERGLIPPPLRVLAAVMLGAALIGAGEYLRRRFGDSPDGTVAFLPATFSGAGVVVIFAAVIAARQLYGLFGPEVALTGYVLTAALSVVLGWFNGALLVAVGLVGAAAAPFLVGGDAQPAPWLYIYYALICGSGLAVDTVRRWAWVSVLALVLGFAGGLAARLIGAGLGGWTLLLTVLPFLATMIPGRNLSPCHEGPTLAFAMKAGHLPSFPVRLATGTLIASSVLMLMALDGPAGQTLLVLAALAFLTVAFLIWAAPAEGLADVAAAPALAFLMALIAVAGGYLPLFFEYYAQNMAARPPETPAPMLVTYLAALAVAMSGAAAWRALRPSPFALMHGIGAVLMAPLALVILDQRWLPADVTGPFPWALHLLAVAALMVALAQRFAAKDGEDHRRTAHAALSSLSLIALALFTLTSATPLTLALAVLLVVATALDRRFGLPEMSVFVQVGLAVLSSRLLIDPGVFWAEDGPLAEVIVAFVGPIAAALASLQIYRGMHRPITSGVLETAALLWLVILADTLIGRWITGGIGLDTSTHWGASLFAMPWLAISLVQAWRSGLGGRLSRLRKWLAALAGVAASAGLLVALTILNPLISPSPDYGGGNVLGIPVFDTLALAYLVPASVLFAGLQRLAFLPLLLRRGGTGAAGLLALMYLGLEIRRFWQGDWLGGTVVAQGELYSYTIALMLIGAGLLYFAILRRSQTLRKVAMAVIAATIAKVFLLDASGLTGLTRVFSFLGLGLSLAGLAWLNRWAGQVSGAAKKP